MSWTVAIAEPGAGLADLVDGRALADPKHADVLLWPARRHAALPVGEVLNVVDLRGVDPAEGVELAGAGLLLVGSATAYGAWAVRAQDVPIAVIPPVVTASAEPSEQFAGLHLLASAHTEGLASFAADWAALRGMDCGVAEGGLELVARLGPAPPIAPGAVVLDLRTGAGRIDASPELLGLMAAGAPVLFAEDTPLRLAIEGAGAGWRFEAIDDGLERVAGLGRAAFARASAGALGFVAGRFGTGNGAFERAVDGALQGSTFRTPTLALAWREREQEGGHVLVVSDEGPNLRQVRVHQPFDALVRRGVIEGYTVLAQGAFACTPSRRFSAIWVQRSQSPQTHLLLRTLGRPFIYDLDDHLLVSPAYRRPFEADAVETAAALVRDCAVLSCATSRLAQFLPAASGKTIVTPNLAYAPPVQQLGPARTLVWASSDVPALGGSRLEIERAVRDFCRAHGLPILCIGNEPPPVFAAAGLRVEHVGLLPYRAYLERLRAAAPGILVGPLETQGDPATQAFVDAKSDIKVIEARLAGLQGVFSRAAPYADSDLGPEILCDNDYAGWMDGLARARAACLQAAPLPAWPKRRDATGSGLLPWAEALRRAATDLSVGEVQAALPFVQAQSATLLESPTVFDEADYLRRHLDVAAAVEAGIVASGYRHFVQSGFREGRAVRRAATAAGEASFWWTRLLHETSGLEESVAARGREIAALQDRVALRRLLPDPAPRPAEPALPPDTWPHWGKGENRTLGCPVCQFDGPHPVVAQPAAALLRCVVCGTCFYADRTVHEYAEPGSDAALQFALEQNASIHHQTRLLFGRTGVASVLDVGCGFGFAVDMAAALLGWRSVGVDPSWAAAAGRDKLGADLRQQYLVDDLDLGGLFDRVIASEVIEHVADPYALLAQLRGRLAPGGTVAITTPNADAIQPGADRGRLLGILAPGIHLTLFTEQSLALALRHAGFTHVAISAGADNLVAEASDQPLRPEADAAHGPAYRAYLEKLMTRAEPGTPLWNGAAGRLLSLLTPGEDLAIVDALFAQIASAWLDGFGIDLERRRLPPALSEAEIAGIGPAALGRRQPFNLAGVLINRALMEQRRASSAATVLEWAALAYRVAVETRRALQAANMVDLDLKRTAWRARLLMLACLSEMVPGLAGTLHQAAGTVSPGQSKDWDDAPSEAVIAMVAPFFLAAVAADRFDEAGRVEPWLADADAVVAALADDGGLLLRTLFMRGVQHLSGHRDPVAASLAFEVLATQARRLGADDYVQIAAQHLALAADALNLER